MDNKKVLANTLSDIQLREYCTHVQYEMQMLKWTAAILGAWRKQDKKTDIEKAIHNALLNSFATHSRNLIDFLYLRNHYHKDKPTDILVEHYVDPEYLAEYLPSVTPILNDAKIKSNKQVAHLAVERSEYETSRKDWSFLEICNQIMLVFFKMSSGFLRTKTTESFLQLISQESVEYEKVVIRQVHQGDEVIGVLFKSPPESSSSLRVLLKLKPRSSTSSFD